MVFTQKFGGLSFNNSGGKTAVICAKISYFAPKHIQIKHVGVILQKLGPMTQCPLIAQPMVSVAQPGPSRV